MMLSASTAAIIQRAADIQDNGAYIGLFDLVVYSITKKRPVLACFGNSIIDVGAVFAPLLAPIVVDAPAVEFKDALLNGPIHICGVQLKAENK